MDGLQPLSARNPRVKRLARLARQRSARDDAGVFVADGPVLVADAVTAGLVIDEVFVEAESQHRPEIAEATARAVASGASGFVLDGSLRGQVDTVAPNGVVAVVRRPQASGVLDQQVEVGAASLVLVLVAVADPGNVGTLIRVAEAAGAAAVVTTAGTADPWSPKAVRASAGSVFRVPVAAGGDASAALATLGRLGHRRVGTRVDAATAYDEADLAGTVALVLGSEAHGLPADLDAELDQLVAIPMAGRVESLNVAIAGALLGFQVFRAHRSNGEA